MFIGIDGGNSGTRALVIDAEAHVLGYGSGGNANHQGQGMDQAVGHIAAALRDALSNSGYSPESVTAVYFAVAGDDTLDDHQNLTARLSSVWSGPFGLGNDVWAGLRAGAIDGSGIAVNCGSGTGTVGRSRNGRTMMLPDIGYIFGDSGGGNQISIDAFRAVSRAADGRGKATALTRLLLDMTQQSDVESLRMALIRNRVSQTTFRQVTPLVLAAAADGDEAATDILQRIGYEIGVAGAAAARRLEMLDYAFPLVLTGGTFRTLTGTLAASAIARVRQEAPHCLPTLPLVLPVAGAALMALDFAGVPVTQGHYERLQEQGYGWPPTTVS